MKKTTNHINICFNLLLLTAILGRIIQQDNCSPSYSVAYLDPGTGTMIISAIVGIFATIILGIKTFWYKIVSIFKPKNKK